MVLFQFTLKTQMHRRLTRFQFCEIRI